MAETYAEKILRLDEQSHRQTLFVANCRRVNQLFRDQHFGSKVQGLHDDFCWLYDLDEEANAAPRGERFAVKYASGEPNNAKRNQILYMSGYPDATTIKQIGECFDVDPAFFDRHLAYYKDEVSTCDIHPSHYRLPSRQREIFQTTVTSVGGVTGNAKPANLGNRRIECERQMESYMHTLRMGREKSFGSIVRDFELYDDFRCSLTQAITVLVKHGKDANDHWLCASVARGQML